MSLRKDNKSRESSQEPNQKEDVILETQKLTKKFGGLIAVNNFDLKVKREEISALIGPNGAGKTTVFNVVTGIYPADGGKIIFKGENLNGCKPHEVAISEYSTFF